jgi:uncharacterized protein (DUF849 family)
MQTPSLPVVIEAAVNGETRPDKNPNVPRKPEEIEADVLRCWYPTLAAGSDMAESLAHVEILAGESG